MDVVERMKCSADSAYVESCFISGRRDEKPVRLLKDKGRVQGLCRE